ncbi:RNA methyltransferase, partial [Vibrio alginolyticus]
MISKNQLKLLRALGQKKQRKAHGLFLVQGEKNVLELASSSLKVKQVFATAAFLEQNAGTLNRFDCVEASLDELTKASTLVSNNAAIAVVEIPSVKEPQAKGLMIALDGVSDPGN